MAYKNKADAAAQAKRYKQEHLEQYRAYHAWYRKNNKDKDRAWRLANKEDLRKKKF